MQLKIVPGYSSFINSSFFFFNDTATTEIYTLSLHDALPISRPAPASPLSAAPGPAAQGQADGLNRLSGRIPPQAGGRPIDHLVAGRGTAPAGLGKPGCPSPPSSCHGSGHLRPRQERPASAPDPPSPAVRSLARRPWSAPGWPRQGCYLPRSLSGVTTFAVNIGIWLMAAPEFDKGTLARTQIGPCGQVTGLPDRQQAYGPLAPCQIPALSALSRLRPSPNHLRSPRDA